MSIRIVHNDAEVAGRIVGDTDQSGNVRTGAGNVVALSNGDPGASSSNKIIHDAASSNQAASSDKLAHDAKSSLDAISSSIRREQASSSDFLHTPTWNPADASGVTLSDTNHVASSQVLTNGGVRGVTSHANTGKYYFELTVQNANNFNQFNIFGIATKDEPLNATGYGGSPNSRTLILGEYGGGGSFNMGTVIIRVAVDLDNNVLQWGTSLDNGTFWFPPTNLGTRGRTWFPFVGFNALSQNSIVTLNEGDRTFSYGPPSGYVSWNQEQAAATGADSTLDAIFVAGSTSLGSANGLGGVGFPANNMLRSDDGTLWDSVSVPANANNSGRSYSAICHAPEINKFIAIAPTAAQTTNQIIESADGRTWTGHTSPALNSWNAVCWSPDLRLFVAIASSGTQRVMTSPDGSTWTLRNSADDTLSWNKIVWATELGLFCAVATDNVANNIMTSPDGITWTARDSGASHQRGESLVWNGTKFVIFDSVNAKAFYSTDGSSWSNIAIGSTGTIEDAAWSPDLQQFLTVASTGTGELRIFSSDLATMTNVNKSSISVGYSWNAAIWSLTLRQFMVGGSGDDVLIASADPINSGWTAILQGTDAAFETEVGSSVGSADFVALVEGILHHETASSEFASMVESLGRASSDSFARSDKRVHDAKSSDDAASSDKLARDAKSSDDAASSDKLARDHKSSDDAISSERLRQEASSSNKLLHDHKSSDDAVSSNKALRDAKSSDDAASSELIREQHSSSDKILHDAHSSDKLLHDAKSSDDAASSNEILREQHSSDKAIFDQHSSSDKPAHDAASSSDKPFHDAASSSNERLRQEHSSDKAIFDAASSSDKPALDAASSSNEILRQAESSEHQSDLAAEVPPPIQTVVIVTT